MCTHSMLLPAASQALQQLQMEHLDLATHGPRSSEPAKISSKYRGLCWDKKHRAWRVRIFYGGKQRHVGRFKDDITAARAYDKAAVYLYGATAILNFTMEECLADPTEVSSFITLAKEQAAAAGLQELLGSSAIFGNPAASPQQQRLNCLQAATPSTAQDLLRLMHQQAPASPSSSCQQFSPMPAAPSSVPLVLQGQQQQWQGQQQQQQSWMQQQQQAACFMPAPLQQTTACGCGASSPHSIISSCSFQTDNTLSTSDAMPAQLLGSSSGMPAYMLAASSISSNACSTAQPMQFLTSLDGQQAVLLPAASAAASASPTNQQCLAASSSANAASGYTTYHVVVPVSSACLALHTAQLQQAVLSTASPGYAPSTAASWPALQQLAGTATSSSSSMTMLQAVSQPMNLQAQMLPGLTAGSQQQQQWSPPQHLPSELPSAMLVNMLDNCHIRHSELSQQWM